MDCNEDINPTPGPSTSPADSVSGSARAVNSLILDYYKKFGRKRDLEQYFSLSTAQSDVKDPSGAFWRKMKSENDSSDSGGKKSDSSQELCRISIRCSVPDPSSSQEEDSKTKSESASPPIITEEAQNVTQNSDEESNKSFDCNSQKSFDVMDTSANKPLSPTSSVTSQRKLEWDSLADVGYANESDRKTSASSLSTLERLALKQQYSNSDTKLDSIIEPPTAHSTPLDENDPKLKIKKGAGKKSTKIYKKDVDYLEVNVPQSSENSPPKSINVNLTKHISFNVEKDGKVTVDNIQKDVSVSPEKAITETPRYKIDKDVQTSLIKNKDSSVQITASQKVPVLISLNTLRRYTRRKKLRMARKKLKQKKKDKENIPVQEKSGEQLSEAESFEYMPGHMYNQNHLTENDRSGNTAGNKSSLESSGLATTDSSKTSKFSFTKDLQHSIDILKAALQNKSDDTVLRKKLIKQVCERLLKSRYRDDESTSDFLSGLSFSSKKLGLSNRNNITTSTSDNSDEKFKRPKKSILRNDKFNASALASSSQSAPNLPIASTSNKLVSTHLMKYLTTSNTDSDLSKEKSSSDNIFAKTSSQELYQKYLDALRREEAYKQHLKDKEMFVKQKLVCSSDSALKVPTRSDIKVNNRLKDLIKDLTRNNYDDGSGDASKLEGGPNSNRDLNQLVPIRTRRSHSVFTLSSGNSDQNKKPNLKKRLSCDLKDLTQPGTSKEHYCCCPHHSRSKPVPASSRPVAIKCNSPSENIGKPPPRVSPRPLKIGDAPDDLSYARLCSKKNTQDVPDNFMVVKCSKFSNHNEECCSTLNVCGRSRNLSPRQNKNTPSVPENIVVPCSNVRAKKPIPEIPCDRTTTKSSQTNFLLKMLRRSGGSTSSSDSKKCSKKADFGPNDRNESKIYGATRSLQTEISIDPKIPEPSLSDINIVSDCAHLVSEHCRCLPVAKPSVTDVFSPRATETYCNSSSKSSGTFKYIDDIIDDNTLRKEANDKICESGSDRSGQFTIPIQGTNMTLMVSIGPNGQRPQKEEMVAECVGTEKPVAEQSTSLTECSKGVQFDDDLPLRPYDQNSDNCGVQNQINDRQVYTSLATDKPNMQVPRTGPEEIRPPTTTDAGNCSKTLTNKNELKKASDSVCTPNASKTCSCGCQKTNCSEDQCGSHPIDSTGHINVLKSSSDSVCKPNATKTCSCGCNQPNCNEDECGSPQIGRNTSVEQETQCSARNSPRCSCGCAGYLKDCNKKCSKNKIISSQCLEKSKSVKCSCGCPGDKECGQKCDSQKNSLKSHSIYGNTDKCNKTNRDARRLQNKCSDKSECSCGCGNDNCGNKCQERKNGTSSRCVEKSVCTCGCGGIIGECSSNCEERNKIAKIQDNPKCPCGCGGNIKDCASNCTEAVASVSPKCGCGCEGDKDNCSKNCDENHSASCGNPKDNAGSCSETQKARNKMVSGNQMSRNDQIRSGDQSEQSDNKISGSDYDQEQDPILAMIQSITKKYAKKDLERNNKKKCYKEIMEVLNYLLQTDDENTDVHVTSESTSSGRKLDKKTSPKKIVSPKKAVSPKRAVSPKKAEKPAHKSNPCMTESSDGPLTTDLPSTSSDSATCRVLNKIKKECERYHQKRCKAHNGKKCEVSSSTSAHCDQCRRVHHCACRTHKCGKPICKCPKKSEKKNPVAYNLILQSESISEETSCVEKPRILKNIVVKVPKDKYCKGLCRPREPKGCRPRSKPNDSEISSMEEFLKRSQACCTVREYLEQNRPEFIAKSSERQNCLRIISDSRDEDKCGSNRLKMLVVHTPSCTGACNMYQYQRGCPPVTCVTSNNITPCTQTCASNDVTKLANMRADQRNLLSMCMAQMSDVNNLDAEQLRSFAKELGRNLRQKPPASKFINEREMKKHSERIYKSLPEVTRKNEEAKKGNIKKTNLLMANIFKNNLQKKTLRGLVDISNYSPIINI